MPPGVSRERLAAEFGAAVSTYQQVQGLLRKHSPLSTDTRASNMRTCASTPRTAHQFDWQRAGNEIGWASDG
jgi:hypothetical protein